MGKKFIPILLAIAAVLCTTPMRGDSPPEGKTVIAIRQVRTQPTVRDFHILSLQAYYDEILESILTMVASDIGKIEVTVTNLLTGEAWWNTFDSGETSQTLLPISGSSGHYEVLYITEYGEVYTGEFIIE